MNCEAASIYEHGARIKEGGYKVCLNDHQEVMERMVQFDKLLDSKQIQMTHDRDLFHGQSSKLCGRRLLTDKLEKRRNSQEAECPCIESVYIMSDKIMSLEMRHFVVRLLQLCVGSQVDVMAGDGNKAAYLYTPKIPGCPTYEVSLLQFWINRMIHTATQSRIKNYGPSPPIRAKHFISCSYDDLVHLNHYLRNIKVDTYTTELAQKTEGYGDSCRLTLLEWGHARNELTEDVRDFEPDDHMDHVGEFSFQVNETCLSGDHRTFMVAPNDKDSHNPILIHITPADMTYIEQRTYVPAQLKINRKERREEKQRTNKRKSY